MKIVFDYQIFSWQRYGGISRYFYEIANRIAALPGNDVEIFAPLYVNEYFRHYCRVRPWGIKTAPFPQSARVINAVNNYLSRFMMKPRHNVNIFHETYYSMTDYCPLSAKRIVTVYDMIHEKFAGCFPDADQLHQMKAHAVRRADHVICISDNTKQDLIELLAVPEDKISVVNLGCSLATNTKKKTINQTAHRKQYILYVGDRIGYKNFETLLRAYAKSSLLKSDFALVCFGGGAFSLNELAAIQSLGIPTDSVRQISGTDDVLAASYAEAAAFVYPSVYEGFGMPPLEAMSFGCPVVCANTSSLPDVVGNAAELFDPINEDDMRSCIERVVCSQERTQRLIKLGYDRIKLFSWEKCARDTLDVYNKLC
jgi:glycosyltransferase involved in cell wall biosynthesis